MQFPSFGVDLVILPVENIIIIIIIITQLFLRALSSLLLPLTTHRDYRGSILTRLHTDPVISCVLPKFLNLKFRKIFGKVFRLLMHRPLLLWTQLPAVSYPKLKTKLHCLSPRANYADRVTAACRRSDCQLFADRGAMWSAWRIPTAVFSIL
jgi:hypothetical protein